MGMNDRQLRRYLRQIRSMLPCGGKRRRELMDNVRSGVTRYLEEHPDATAEQVMAYFGAPEAIAASYVESAGTAEILRAVRIRRKITAMVAVVLLVILLSWAAVVTWAVIDAYRDVRGDILVTTTEIERTVIEP
jgi:hypothetical protein